VVIERLRRWPAISIDTGAGRHAKHSEVLALIHTAQQESRRRKNREDFNQLLAIFEAGHRTTWAESRAFAKLVREITRPHTKKDRGKRTAAVAYEIENFRGAAVAVEYHAARFRVSKALAIENMCAMWGASRMDRCQDAGPFRHPHCRKALWPFGPVLYR
jgi:hypothetical protein